ncbi:MAG: FAD-dependent oxidoreductase [Woeseiaceae bacterium]
MASDRIIVVGAGHIGIACAHYLRQDGYEVTVIDQGRIGDACSRANCGFVAPSHVLPLTTPQKIRDGLLSIFRPRAAFRIKPQLRASLYRWLFQFARRCTHRQMLEAGRALRSILEASASEYRELLADPAMDCEWHDSGLMFLFAAEEALGEYAKVNEMLAGNFGLSAKLIPGDQLAQLEPALRDGLAGAFLYEDDGFLRPDKLNATWSHRLRNDGVTFVEDCRLDRIEKTTGSISALHTTRGEMKADQYVFATGAWSSLLAKDLECDIPIEPGKGFSVTMESPELMPKRAMLSEEAHIGITPFDGGLRIGSMMEFAGFDDSLPNFRIQQLKDAAAMFLKQPVGAVDTHTWYGWRPMTWDSLPIVGRVPRLSNALLAAGHNMLGLTLAPVTGKIIADILAERPTSLPIEALSPARFS